jgi:hemoglobin-like flavoprotein
MTPDEIHLVQRSWEKVVPIAKDAASLFYGRLFDLRPEYRALFSEDVDEQGKKLMQVLTTVVRGLTHIEKLELTVWQLGRRHVAYGVKDEDYAPVAEALLWTLQQGLGSDFDEATKQAWVSAYTVLANVMQAGAHAEYANFSVWKQAQS